MYLDVTDPNGIQLTALDEAIGFDSSVLLVSDVRTASGLAGLGSYATASTVDNGSGALLVGQAFMGSGLPPLVPYGTDVPVLQFDVTLNAAAALGSETGIRLLQYGTVNGQMKYTAISDNEGALTWTPGMAPSNSGNPVIDGSVTVVVPLMATVPSPVDTTHPAVPPEVVEPLRKVRAPSLTSGPVTSMTRPSASPTISETGVSLVVPLVNDAATISVEETVISNTGALPSPMSAQPEITILSVSAPVVLAEFAQVANMVPSSTKVEDSGASLCLVAVGTNKGNSTGSIASPNVRSVTSVLDEMYRQLSVMAETISVNGASAVAGFGTTEEDLDVWGLEEFLAELDPRNRTAESGSQ